MPSSGRARQVAASGTRWRAAARGRIDAARHHVVALARRGDDHRARAGRDAAGERRVEQPLHPHLPQSGLNIPTGSNTYGTPRARHRVATVVVTGSRNPITWATSGRVSRRNARGSVGDAHPAVAERRAEVATRAPSTVVTVVRRAGRSATSRSVVVTTST